jgi:hypothetical protein
MIVRRPGRGTMQHGTPEAAAITSPDMFCAIPEEELSILRVSARGTLWISFGATGEVFWRGPTRCSPQPASFTGTSWQIRAREKARMLQPA